MAASKNPTEDTRTRIIRAATGVFAEHGYQKATISEISRLAGISEASLYEYFESKEELLLVIPNVWVIEAIEELEEHLFGVKGSDKPAQEIPLVVPSIYRERASDSQGCVPFSKRTSELSGHCGLHQCPNVLRSAAEDFRRRSGFRRVQGRP